MVIQVLYENKVLGRFCGSENSADGNHPKNEPVWSPGNKLTLVFQSDESNPDHHKNLGFSAHYQAIGRCSDNQGTTSCRGAVNYEALTKQKLTPFQTLMSVQHQNLEMVPSVPKYVLTLWDPIFAPVTMAMTFARTSALVCVSSVFSAVWMAKNQVSGCCFISVPYLSQSQLANYQEEKRNSKFWVRSVLINAIM